MEIKEKKNDCSKCNGTGMVKEKNGTVHICFDCLEKNVFDQHGNPRDSDIRL